MWIQNRIFVKPLPRYILSFAFWKQHLTEEGASPSLRSQQDRTRRAALGLLRTYWYLIQYESDFRIAQDLSCCLIPPRVTWRQFCNFSSEFGSILDAHVTERYKYGEIRLTRLNLYAKILLHKWHFQRMNPQYGSYFARFYAPILFIFGVISVMLSALQVELSIEQIGPTIISDVSRWFGILCLVGVLTMAISLVSLLLYKIAKEWRYALKDRARSCKSNC